MKGGRGRGRGWEGGKEEEVGKEGMERGEGGV